MNRVWTALFFMVACSLVSPAVAADKNILAMNEGTVFLSASSEYDQAEWSAFNAFDGNPSSSWCSNAPSNQELVVELPQKFELSGFAVDTRQVQERKYPGIAAKTVEVHASTTGPDSGFTKISTAQIKKKERVVVALPEKPQAQWLKFVIVNNWGDKKYVEISEIEAFGEKVGSAANPSFSGTFSSNYGPMKLKQDGPVVTGCYEQKKGSIKGGASGRVFRFEWSQEETKTNGTALMVMNGAGNILNGVWYLDGKMKGEWIGKKDDNAACNCEPASAAIADRLQGDNKVILYGVFFESDTAEMKQDSDTTLTEILSILKKDPSIKINIDGHTDSSNTVEYNQALSKDRAQAVLKWLSMNGISEDRMRAKGFGETVPVADNATAQGRALNRRVEISMMK